MPPSLWRGWGGLEALTSTFAFGLVDALPGATGSVMSHVVTPIALYRRGALRPELLVVYCHSNRPVFAYGAVEWVVRREQCVENFAIAEELLQICGVGGHYCRD